MDPQNPYLHSALGVIIGIVVSRVSTFQSVSILLIILLQLPLIKNFDRRKLRHNFWHLGADGRRYRSARTSFELFYEGSRWVVRPTGEPAYGLRSSDGASRWRPTASSGLWEAHSGGGWLQMPWVQLVQLDDAVDGRGRVRDRDDAALATTPARCWRARWLGAVDAAVRLPPPRLRFGASVLEEVCVFATGKRPRRTTPTPFCSRKFLKHCPRPARRRGGRRRSSTATPSRPPRARSTRSATSSSTRREPTTTTPADGDDDDSDADARTDDALGPRRSWMRWSATGRRRSSRRASARAGAAAEDPLVARARRDRRDACSERCPGAWRCPITHDIMRDPVLVVESVGNTYERRAIEAWFARRGPLTDPKSGLPVSSSVVVPNLLLASLIRDWFKASTICVNASV
ncbi:ubiquitin-protein transferase [Aureococcus anophagefferens]|nr:ubiquitin-protein transferase [Aureococcus anophagefferens]